MVEGIIVGIASTIGIGILTWLCAALIRLWRTPKRIDRLEKLIPPIARGLLALLEVHKGEGTNGNVKEAHEELQGLLCNQAVSQKAQS